MKWAQNYLPAQCGQSLNLNSWHRSVPDQSAHVVQQRFHDRNKGRTTGKKSTLVGMVHGRACIDQWHCSPKRGRVWGRGWGKEERPYPASGVSATLGQMLITRMPLDFNACNKMESCIGQAHVEPSPFVTDHTINRVPKDSHRSTVGKGFPALLHSTSLECLQNLHALLAQLTDSHRQPRTNIGAQGKQTLHVSIRKDSSI